MTSHICVIRSIICGLSVISKYVGAFITLFRAHIQSTRDWGIVPVARSPNVTRFSLRSISSRFTLVNVPGINWRVFLSRLCLVFRHGAWFSAWSNIPSMGWNFAGYIMALISSFLLFLLCCYFFSQILLCCFLPLAQLSISHSSLQCQR